MPKLQTVLLTLLAGTLVLGIAQAKEKQAEEKQAQEKQSHAEKTAGAVAQCPVGGKPIDQTAYTYYKNRRVYFCCEHCKSIYEKEPAKYTAGVEKQWAALPLIRRQVNCPVTGKPIKLEFHAEAPDMRIYFASEEAKKTWESWPEAKRKARTEKMFTFQTKCPISGNDINPEVFRELDGQRVYFFCDVCAGEGEAKPKETAKKAQAISKENSNAYTMQQLDRLKEILEQQKKKDEKKTG